MTILAAASLASCTPGPTTSEHLPGLGDSYYPDLGNPGYSADHYSLDLDIDPMRDTLAGTATIDARATSDLPRLAFDLVGLDVQSVTVDGQAASWSREGAKLAVVPGRRLASGTHFSVVVAYRGTPQPIDDVSGSRTGAAQVGWHHDGDEVYVASEVAGARTWFPVNDSPRNKATYAFNLTVPAGYTAVANGTPTGVMQHTATTTFAWDSRQPMASYLATVDVGRFTRILTGRMTSNTGTSSTRWTTRRSSTIPTCRRIRSCRSCGRCSCRTVTPRRTIRSSAPWG